MNAPAYEPKVMKHPQSRKSVITELAGVDATSGKPFKDYQGTPDVFPDVTVKDEKTEEYYRARGYGVPGEVPPAPAEYAEYPVMLSHPEHVDAVPDDFLVEKGPNNEIIRHKVPGSPEKYPPRMALNADEETNWISKGYARVGHDNPDAIRTSHASPYDPNRKHAEYPKIVGTVVIDPNAPSGGPKQYPKYVGDRLVHSAAEEEAITGEKPSAPLEGCIICGEEITEDDPAGSGPKGKYHLAHMAPPPQPLTAAQSINADEIHPGAVSGGLPTMTKGQKIAFTRAKNKAAKEAAAKSESSN